MNVDLDCNHQVPIQVRFVLQKLTSPKKLHFSDFWCHGCTIRQDYNHWGKKNKLEKFRKNTGMRSHVFQDPGDNFHPAGWSWKTSGSAILPTGQVDHAAQRPSRTLRGTSLHLWLSISPLIRMAWTLLPATGGWNHF